MTNQEFVRLLYQLPKHPETKDTLVEEVRRRGISFQLTDGLRSLIATKSGNDATLRRTLEEAERRRQNPSSFQPLRLRKRARCLRSLAWLPWPPRSPCRTS